jgi:hypothetical protein
LVMCWNSNALVIFWHSNGLDMCSNYVLEYC